MSLRYELRNKERGVKIKLSGEYIRLGRAEDNNVLINDPSISRYHLNLYIKNDSLIVEDAGSKTGFFVNGIAQRDPVKLRNGDLLKIGTQNYSVFIGQEESLNSTQSTFNSVPEVKPSSKVRLVIVASAALLIALAMLPEDKKVIPQAQDVLPQAEEIERSLEASTLLKDTLRHKSRGEIESEAKFNQGIREYQNGNFVRALNRFEEALTQNPSMEQAQDYLQFAQARLKIQLNQLIQDGQRSYAVLQYSRCKSQMSQVLSILSEQIPGYWQQKAQKTLNLDENERRPAQEEILLDIPCNKTREESLCKLAVELIKQARQALGEEDSLR